MKKILWIVFAGAVWTACGERKPSDNDKPASADSAVAASADTPVKVVTPVVLDSGALEDRIIDTLLRVPQVVAQSKYMEKETKGERRLKLWIGSRPSEGDKYYWVKAGEDNGMSLVTIFDFHVYPDSMRIMYYDVAEDREMTLREWEEKEKKK